MNTMINDVFVGDDLFIDDALRGVASQARKALDSLDEAESKTLARVRTILSCLTSLRATWIFFLCAIAGSVAFRVHLERNRDAVPSVTSDVRYDAFYIQPHHH